MLDPRPMTDFEIKIPLSERAGHKVIVRISAILYASKYVAVSA